MFNRFSGDGWGHRIWDTIYFGNLTKVSVWVWYVDESILGNAEQTVKEHLKPLSDAELYVRGRRQNVEWVYGPPNFVSSLFSATQDANILENIIDPLQDRRQLWKRSSDRSGVYAIWFDQSEYEAYQAISKVRMQEAVNFL